MVSGGSLSLLLTLSSVLGTSRAHAAVPTGRAFEDQAKAVWNELKIGPEHDELGFPRWTIVPAPDHSRRHGSFELRVLSLNVHGLAEIFVGKKEFPEVRYREIGGILKALRAAGTAPHIVALQEAFVPKTDDIALVAGYPYVARGPAGKGVRLNSGLVIMSEFPLVDPDSIVYGHCAALDCLARKGAQYARVMIPGLPGGLAVFNTHLNADPDPKWMGRKDQTDRAAWTQTWDLREFLSTKKVFSAPTLVISDLNYRPKEFAYESFAGWLLLGGMRESIRACLDTPSCKADPDAEAYWERAVDHQFFVGGTQPVVSIEPLAFTKTMEQRVNGHRLTDHRGQEIRYRLRW